MSINKLDHVSIRTAELEATRRFYTEVMGFEVGPRPNFPFPGVWLYNGGTAVVHVIGIDPNDKAGLHDYLGDKDADGQVGTGSLDHVAFVGTDIDGLRERFRSTGTPFRERTVPTMNLRQIFIDDPNGVTIELNFPG